MTPAPPRFNQATIGLVAAVNLEAAVHRTATVDAIAYRLIPMDRSVGKTEMLEIDDKNITKPKTQKSKRCRVCRSPFMPVRPLQVICFDISCALAIAEKSRVKKQAAEAKAARDRERQNQAERKPIEYWLKRTEKAVNSLVRKRDENEPCISCGTWDAQEWHAGHFIPVGRAKSIRFDLSNIHKQCNQCNIHYHSNATNYEIRLVAKIGQAEVDRLKTAPKERKWSREELQAIEKDSKSKIKELK